MQPESLHALLTLAVILIGLAEVDDVAKDMVTPNRTTKNEGNNDPKQDYIEGNITLLEYENRIEKEYDW